MSIMTSSGDLYRFAPGEHFPFGHSTELFRSVIDGSIQVVPRADLELAARCWEFSTLEHHADRIARDECLGLERDGLLNHLQALLDTNLFISYRALRSRSVQYSAPAARKIGSIGIPTRGRLPMVVRCLDSILDNITHYDHKCAVNVFDDSIGTEEQNDTHNLLRLKSNDSGVSLGYCGYTDRLRFIQQLSSDIPPSVSKFAFVGLDRALTSTGVNRNAMMMQAIGELCLSVDDDIVWTTGMSVNSDETLVQMSHECETDNVRSYLDRAEAIAHIVPRDIDIIAEHTRMLGATLQDLLYESALTVDIAKTCPQMVRAMASGDGRVVLTLNGIVGDSGFRSPFDLPLHPSGAAISALLSSEAPAEMIDSREVVRQSETRNISHAGPFMSPMCGLDNSRILPPWLPHYRNEDGLYGSVLAASRPEAYSGHLPFVVMHDPCDCRSNCSSPTTARISDILILLVNSWPASYLIDPVARMKSLGRYLVDLAHLPDNDFDALVRSRLLAHISCRIMAREALIGNITMEGVEGAPVLAVLGRQIEALRSEALLANLHTPLEYRSDNGARDATPSLQRLIEQFGQLLQWWPSIWDCAAYLAGREIRIVQQLC